MTDPVASEPPETPRIRRTRTVVVEASLRDVKATDTTVLAADGYRLAATRFHAPGTGRDDPCVIISGATGARRGFYAPFARWLASGGFHVVTYDYRGIGGSRPASLRDFQATMTDWGKLDFEGVLRTVLDDHPRSPVRLLGHSVGAQVIGLAPSSRMLDAIAIVAAGSGYWGLWPAHLRYLMAALWYAALPAVVSAYGFLPGSIGVEEDLPKGVAMQWARWCRSPAYLASELKDLSGYHAIRAPILAMSFSDDLYAPERAVEGLVNLYPNASVERLRFTPADAGGAPIKHFGFFRRKFRGSLWPAVGNFLAAPPAHPLASPAASPVIPKRPA